MPANATTGRSGRTTSEAQRRSDAGGADGVREIPGPALLEARGKAFFDLRIFARD
jgi:hypothetical protein